MKRSVQIIVFSASFSLVPYSLAQVTNENMFTLPVSGELTASRYDVAGDSSRNIHIVWIDGSQDTRSIMYTYRREGERWHEPEQVSVDSVEVGNPSIAVDSFGNVHVVYARIDPVSGSYQAVYRFREAPAIWSSPIVFSSSTGNGYSAGVFAGPAGSLFFHGLDRDIYFLSGTGEFLEPISYPTFEIPVLVFDSEGKLIAFWFDESNQDLRYSVYVPTSGWQDPVVVTDSARVFGAICADGICYLSIMRRSSDGLVLYGNESQGWREQFVTNLGGIVLFGNHHGIVVQLYYETYIDYYPLWLTWLRPDGELAEPTLVAAGGLLSDIFGFRIVQGNTDSLHCFFVQENPNITFTLKHYRQPAIRTNVAERAESAPSEFVLHQNHPNPFQPHNGMGTMIEFEASQGTPAIITIYNLLGRKVKTLSALAGRNNVVWDGRDDAGKVVGAGVYCYGLEIGERVVHGKMLVLR